MLRKYCIPPLVSSVAFTIVFCLRAERLESQQKVLSRIDISSIEGHMTATPLNSAKHHRYIVQMEELGDVRRAYVFYKKKNELQPTSAYANLWQGVAGAEYWEESSIYRTDHANIDEPNELLATIRACFETAAQLDPNSSIVKSEYGFFLWQRDSQMARGLAMIRAASTKDPKDPLVHYFLGSIYSNHSGNAYSLKNAEQELKQAILLAPDYPRSYWCLASVYADEKRNPEARKMLLACQHLLPRAYWLTTRGRIVGKLMATMNATLSGK